MTTTTRSTMPRFNATIEFIGGQRAVITLTDSSGEFAAGGRIDTRCSPALCGHPVRDSLYEEGYRLASVTAAAKGGVLDTYRVTP